MFKLPQLPYAFGALEPYIDEETMRIHHEKHHGTYVEKLNKALENHEDLKAKTIEELLRQLDNLPEEIKGAVRNHGGGHANHSLFWKIMSPNNDGEPKEDLREEIEKNFGDFISFKEQFTNAAASHFGSGWAWLAKKDSFLEILTSQNQDSPLSLGYIPILGLDVWEHAYYLKYQNRRAEYIQNWWHVVNWRQVEENFRESLASGS